MAFTNIAAPAVGDATKKSLVDAIIDNLSYLYNAVLRVLTTDGFENGSFETDVDGDGVPDGWTKTLTGGAFALETTAANVAHGTVSAKFTSTGAGGGYLQYTDYFEVTVNRPPVFQWQMKSSVAGVTNKVEVLFYDGAKSFISTVVIYTNTTSNPTAWTLTRGTATPPSGSKYARLKITGADSATTGSTWFDDFQMSTQSAFNVPAGMQLFTATGTFTVPSGVVRVRVKAWGGGAGGSNLGGSGGSGGYAEGIVSVTPGAAITVTIGAGGAANVSGGIGTGGGATSFAASVAANGGSGGGGSDGAGGAGTAGTILLTGKSGIGTTFYGYAAFSTSFGRGGLASGNGLNGAVIVEW